mmetsp:Transcript_68466/g.196398  ORF Transcript_68466/g.196398 Transcript_68466/m.196398 type:complete len:601 (-) Transcript_68466:44-1846(-)
MTGESKVKLMLPTTKVVHFADECGSGGGKSTMLLGRNSPTKSKVTFEHVLTQDNAGDLKDYYEMPWGSWLGKGAYGTVRRAVCKRTGLEMAIKSISIPAVEDKPKLEAEIAVQQRLHHPNVVRLFETFKTDTQLHLVMEICSGGELFEKITKDAPEGFPEAQAAAYVRQIDAAVCYLHGRHIAHRDLKPENFLLCGGGGDTEAAILKLADFGNARTFEVKGPPMTTQVGTPYYVAPEVLEGSYNELCDVWSIGVMAYVLLSGYPPFRGKNPGTILKRVLKGVVKYVGPEWDRVSRPGKALVAAMLTRQPSGRLSARQVFADPWLRPADAEHTPRIDSKVVQRLLEFEERAPSLLKQVAVTAVAQHLPDEALEAWRSAFQALDTDGDGMISLKELSQGLIREGLTMPDLLEDTMRALDSDGSGSVDYTEFLAATMDQRLCCQKELCRAAFHTLDLDGDGAITPQELGHVLAGGDADKTPSKSVLYKLVEEADLNGDGVVDFEEFCTMMKPQRRTMLGSARASFARLTELRFSGAWAAPAKSGSVKKASQRRGSLSFLGAAASSMCGCGPCFRDSSSAAAAAAYAAAAAAAHGGRCGTASGR